MTIAIQSTPPMPCPRPHWINDGTCDKNEIDSVFKMDICRFDGGDCCERNLIGNGVCDEVNNFESCGNFDGGDCIMIKGPAIYGKVTAKPSTTTEETVSQLILNQIKTNKSQKSSLDIEIYGEYLTPCQKTAWIKDGVCDKDEAEFKMEACQFDGGDCCQKSLIGNGICEEANNFGSCGNFDGGDCKEEAEKEYPSNEYGDDEQLLAEFVEYAYNDPCKFTKCKLNSKCVNDKGMVKCVELCDLVKCGLNQNCVARNGEAECVFKKNKTSTITTARITTTTTPTTAEATTVVATTTTTTTATTTTRKPRKPKQVQTNSASLFPTIGLPKYWFPTIRFA